MAADWSNADHWQSESGRFVEAKQEGDEMGYQDVDGHDVDGNGRLIPKPPQADAIIRDAARIIANRQRILREKYDEYARGEQLDGCYWCGSHAHHSLDCQEAKC